MTTTTTLAAPNVRDCIAAIASTLQLPIDADPAAGLSLTIGDMPVCIEPTAHGRLAAFFKLGDIARVSVPVMVSLLADASAWGVDGEILRFAAVGEDFVLLWTPVPMASGPLLSQWRQTMATAVSAHAFTARFAD